MVFFPSPAASKYIMPKLNLPKVRKIILTVFAGLIIFGSGYFLGVKGFSANFAKFPKVKISRTVPVNQGTLDFSLFWKVWDTLSAKYFDKTRLVPSQMVYGAISGMVSSLGDPYTVFLPPSQNKVVEEDLSGSFEGVGIQIGYKGSQLAVVAPLPGSPAEKAGVKAGDFIIGIKDELKKIDRGTVGISLPEAVQAIRGSAGTRVTLTIIREGSDQPIVIDIVRANVQVPSVTLEFVGPNKDIAHIRLMKFGSDTLSEWDSKVSEILSKNSVKAVILDLRNNPGGYLQGAVDIASDFIKTGNVVVIEQRSDGTKKDYKVESRLGKLTDLPVVVLVNGGSASASEILAGALRDDLGAKLVGETTFGKGTIQEPEDLDGGAGLHITIAKWLTPSGVWVNEKGLDPDIKIKIDPNATSDAQLNAAIQLFLSQ